MKSGKIEINRELCKACGYCILSCTAGCISEGAELNSAGYISVVFSNRTSCTGCALCAIMCPDIAIEVWRDKNKKTLT